MKFHKSVVIVLCVLGSGCWQRNVPDPDLSATPPRVLALRYDHEAAEVRQGIVDAIVKRRWMVEREAPSEIVTRLMKTGVTVRLRLEYSTDRIVITGVTALGAGRNYDKWLSNLEQSILAELREPAPSVTSEPKPVTAAGTEARPPVAAPPVVSEEPPAPTVDPVTGLALTWANRASFFIGARGSLGVPPGALGFAPSLAIELGVAPPTGFGFGLRALYMSNPPGVPFLGIAPSEYGFGALADFRYYFETVDPLILYPTISAGFLAGQTRGSMQNVAIPLFNLGVGVKLKFGNLFTSFEFGVSGFTIPFLAINVGYESDSKITKERRRIEALPAPVVPVAPVTPPPG